MQQYGIQDPVCNEASGAVKETYDETSYQQGSTGTRTYIRFVCPKGTRCVGTGKNIQPDPKYSYSYPEGICLSEEGIAEQQKEKAAALANQAALAANAENARRRVLKERAQARQKLEEAAEQERIVEEEKRAEARAVASRTQNFSTLRRELAERITNPKDKLASLFSFSKKQPLTLTPEQKAFADKVGSYDSMGKTSEQLTTNFGALLTEGSLLFDESKNTGKAYPRISRLFKTRKGKNGRNLFASQTAGRRRTRRKVRRTRRHR